MKIRRILSIIFATVLLTFITQIGGLVLMACIPIFNWIKPQIEHNYLRTGVNALLFVLLYGIVSFVVVPPLAAHFGRVPMPYNDDSPFVKPHNFLTVLANRHYVTPSMRENTEGVARKVAERFKDSISMRYLDACFPFWDGFPLVPHLTHNDGRKLDIAFYYAQSIDNQPISNSPSWLGYGVSEEPRAGEENQPDFCREKGEWQYNFMRRYIIPQNWKPDYRFDAKKTAEMVRLFTANSRVRFILIEPHLKARLGFQNNNKVRIPPCHAVRHDDHIHVVVD
jgi:hypothetical protein